MDNIAQLRVCQFSYTPEYAATVGMATSYDYHDVGLIAQELQQVIPDAVYCNVCNVYVMYVMYVAICVLWLCNV